MPSPYRNLVRSCLIFLTLSLSACFAPEIVRKPKLIAMDVIDDNSNFPKPVIRRVILSRKGAYQNCYEQQLQHKPDLNGQISINLKVSGTSGNVLVAKVVGTTMNSPPVEQCILGHIRKLRFPAPKNGKTVIFTYPFRFRPS